MALAESQVSKATGFGPRVLSGETEPGISFTTSLIAGRTDHETEFSLQSLVQTAYLIWASGSPSLKWECLLVHRVVVKRNQNQHAIDWGNEETEVQRG